MIEEKILSKYSLDAQKRYLIDQKIDQYKKSFFKFVKFGLGYNLLETKPHKEICDLFQSESKRKLIVIPRGCFKSTIGSIAFPIWCLTKDTDLRILIDSELYTNSSKFLREIKGHIESAHFKELYGDWKSDTNWTESEITIKTRKRVRKEASITCSGIGAQKTSQHYDLIVADDLNSPDNSMTEDQRQKVIDHYRLYTSLLEPGGTIVVIGTRYSQGDLIGHIIANEIEESQKKGLIL